MSYTIQCALDTLNDVPPRSIQKTSKYYGIILKLSLHNFRIWGCQSYVLKWTEWEVGSVL